MAQKQIKIGSKTRTSIKRPKTIPVVKVKIPLKAKLPKKEEEEIEQPVIEQTVVVHQPLDIGWSNARRKHLRKKKKIRAKKQKEKYLNNGR